MRERRIGFVLLLGFVIVCIGLDAAQQVWVEWRRLLWGELAMAVREKIRLMWTRSLRAS